jgi:serine/threonine-protein kinase HipA
MGTVKIHQEEFFQILEKKDKYQGSVEQIGKKLGEISAVPGLDVQLFFERVVFNFLIGNGDAHFKNFSVLYHEEGGLRLSPAYDLVASSLVIPNEQDSALTVNGKKNNLTRGDFEGLADFLEIPARVRYERFEGKLGRIGKVVEDSLMSGEFKEKLVQILASRYDRLKIRGG